MIMQTNIYKLFYYLIVFYKLIELYSLFRNLLLKIINIFNNDTLVIGMRIGCRT